MRISHKCPHYPECPHYAVKNLRASLYTKYKYTHTSFMVFDLSHKPCFFSTEETFNTEVNTSAFFY